MTRPARESAPGPVRDGAADPRRGSARESSGDSNRALLLVAGAVTVLLLVGASVPTDALARFFDHPAHPMKSAPDDLARAARSAMWFRTAALGAALAWIAGALVLARRRRDRRDEEGDLARPRASAPGAAHGVRPPPMPRRSTVVLAAILLLAIAVRIPFLVHGLWFDEIAAIGDFTKYGPGPILGSWFTPSNHVLQSLLSWLSDQAFGTSEATLRLPSLLAGLVAVVAVHAAARRVAIGATPSATRAGFADLAGLLAALAMALMPVAVLESTEARGYSLVMAFTAISIWAFVRGVQQGDSWTWALLAISGALAVWSHFVAVVVMLSVGLVAALDLGAASIGRGAAGRAGESSESRAARRSRDLSALTAFVMSGALACALLAPLLPDVLDTREQFRASATASAPAAGAAPALASGASNASALGTPTLASAEGLRVLLTLTGTWAAALPPLAASIPGALLLVIGCVCAARARSSRLALGAALSGLPILLLIVIVGGSWTYARFASFVIPGAAIAIGLGAAAALAWNRRAGAALVALAAASYAMELSLLPPRQPYLEAMDEAASRATRRDIVVDASIRGAPSAFYAPPGLPVISAGSMAERLDDATKDARVRFVVLSYPRVLPIDREATLRARGFVLEREWPGWIDWGGGSVQLWQRANAAPPSPSAPR